MNKLLNLIPKFLFSTENLGEIELPKNLSSGMVIKILQYPKLNDEDFLKKLMVDMNQSMGGNLTNLDEKEITLGDITLFSKELCKNPTSNDFITNYVSQIKTEVVESVNQSKAFVEYMLKPLNYTESVIKPFNYVNGITKQAMPTIVIQDQISERLKKYDEDILANSIEWHRSQSKRTEQINTVVDILVQKNTGFRKWISIAAVVGTIFGGFSTSIYHYWQYKKEIRVCTPSSVVIDTGQTTKRPRNIVE